MALVEIWTLEKEIGGKPLLVMDFEETFVEVKVAPYLGSAIWGILVEVMDFEETVVAGSLFSTGSSYSGGRAARFAVVIQSDEAWKEATQNETVPFALDRPF